DFVAIARATILPRDDEGGTVPGHTRQYLGPRRGTNRDAGEIEDLSGGSDAGGVDIPILAVAKVLPNYEEDAAAERRAPCLLRVGRGRDRERLFVERLAVARHAHRHDVRVAAQALADVSLRPAACLPGDQKHILAVSRAGNISIAAF